VSVQASEEIQAFVSGYIDDLNAAVASREFPPLVKKWFALDGCSLTFAHEAEGLDNAVKLWTHLLPKGQQAEDGAPREVVQTVYRIDDGRVHTFRALQGGNAPKPLYGLQETQFDDRSMISEIIIRSVQDEPQVDLDPDAQKTRLGRIFMAFAEAFNEYFESGDPRILTEWCSQDVRMALDSTFWGMGVISPHNRIAETARFTVEGVEQVADDRLTADVGFVDWGGLDGRSPWDMTFTPDLKIRDMRIGLEI
jgi:hypothetical protein